jgi:hypothetical protein
MKIRSKIAIWMSCVMIAMPISAQPVYGQEPSRNSPSKIAGVDVADILRRLGAKQEWGITEDQFNRYINHFDRADPDQDGKHTRDEYINGGGYMTPQARAGIFKAADSDGDGIVTRDEYILNRIITVEGKAIVQGTLYSARCRMSVMYGISR